jgi:trk system potassium uptake protein TrkA
MKVLIAGAGKIAREILRRMGEAWCVTLVDVIPERLGVLKTASRRVTKTVLGDASSTITLRGADLEEHDFVVAATNRDDVNLEVSRLAKNAGIKNIIALANDSVNRKKMEELGVRTICWSDLAAKEVELYLESPRLFVTTIGDGKGEIMEIEVSRNASVVGKKIRELRARNWHIAAVYRKGSLIIPYGDTVIEACDRITIIGHTDLYQAIAQLFGCEEPSFPLVYGQNILAMIEDGESLRKILPEAFYLVKNTRAQKVILLIPKEQEKTLLEEIQNIEEPVELDIRRVEEKMADVVAPITHHESIGCVLIPPPSPGILSRIFSPDMVTPLAHKLFSPLLIARGTRPYKEILVPYNATQKSGLALEVAIDIAKQVDANISVAVVSEPMFVKGEESGDWVARALDHAREIAQIHKFSVTEIQCCGNPVKEVVKLAEKSDLMILGSTTRDVPFLKPHIGESLIEKSACSVMVVAS